MKNALYVIAILLIIIWMIVYFNFPTTSIVHSLLILAGVVILVRIIFSNALTGK